MRPPPRSCTRSRQRSDRGGGGFFFQAEDGIRDKLVTGVQTCALPISHARRRAPPGVRAAGGPGRPPVASATIVAVKIATWNVNSIRTRLPRLLAWLERRRPDVVCLQETKVADDQFPFAELAGLGYTALAAGQQTYNGVAGRGRGAGRSSSAAPGGAAFLGLMAGGFLDWLGFHGREGGLFPGGTTAPAPSTAAGGSESTTSC